MDNDQERIREEAHKLWEAEGRPDGRAERHWAEAREIVALKDSMGSTLKPLKDTLDEPAESPLAVENLGDLPGMTDQGDEVLAPSLDAARELADQDPLVTDKDAKKSKKAKASPAAKPESAKSKSADKSEKSKTSAEKGKAKEKPAPKRKSA